jgi:hypothetical protein
MGLPARQLRVLDRIETTLRVSDPRLAALFAIFARLTCDEEMPKIEQLRHRVLMLVARLRLALAGSRARLHVRLIPRQPAVLFFPLAVAVLALSIVFAVRSSSGSSCTPARTVAVSKYPAQTRICKIPTDLPQLTSGH